MLGDADSLALEQARDHDEPSAEPATPAKRGRKRKVVEEPVSFFVSLNLLVFNLLRCRIKLLCTFLMNLRCIFRHCIIRRLNNPYHLRLQFRSISRHYLLPALHYIHQERLYIILVRSVCIIKDLRKKY